MSERTRPEARPRPPGTTDAGGASSSIASASVPGEDPWRVDLGSGPFVGLALHSGHEIRPSLRAALAVDDETRLREEDPYTEGIAALCGTRVLTFRSRFEVDLNRPADEAVCVQPSDCWNLQVWQQPNGLTQTMYRRSLDEHARFYSMLGDLLEWIEKREQRFLVLDCHSYNHRRGGPNEPPANPELNPEINVGTGSMDRKYWAPVVDHFMSALSGADYRGRSLDVRENVRFRGRFLAQFVHDRFPRSGCCLAIEVKKFFMDEWTGEVDQNAYAPLLAAFRTALSATEGALEAVP